MTRKLFLECVPKNIEWFMKYKRIWDSYNSRKTNLYYQLFKEEKKCKM